MNLSIIFFTFALVLAIIAVFVPLQAHIYNRLLAGAIAFLSAAFLVGRAG
jgi:hypothetical protein